MCIHLNLMIFTKIIRGFISATQQQRQQHIQQAQDKILQPQSDVRLDTTNQERLTLSNHEMPCYPIHRISLVDYSTTPSSSESQFQWAFDKAAHDLNLTLPHCFGGEGLGILMKQIQNSIIEKGYVTTRVVTQEQDLRSGALTLTMIAGKVGNTLVSDSGNIPRFTRLHALTGLTFEKGDVLNVREIEQSLENLKRVPTAEANIEILPSETDVGVSDIKISYQQAFPFRVNLGLDDSGSTSTGKYQASGTLSLDNLFSANDLFYTSFTHSLKSSDDEDGKRATKNLTFYYSIPFGYWTLSASQTYNRYHQEVFGAFDNNYLYAGESNTTKATLSYLLYRDSKRKTSISGSFWSRQSQNYIDGAEIEVQKRRMAGWEAGISHKEYIGDATLELSANYKRGTGARGSLEAPEELWGEGTSRPKIITASIELTKPFMLGEQPWQYQSSWNAQWNKTPLIAQDRFSIGGRYTVRGFDGELTLSGERGWLWRNELAWNVNQKGHQLYLALDGGRVMGWSTASQLGHHLMGAALGLKGGFSGFYYDVFVGRPVRKPEGFRTSDAVAGFNIGYSF
ncbi:ShlB/FhaC/HecB family hemolysin secretion/activation protein [Actinobacillus pleuropneumoniae]|uniref:ShlB/FhaC/HecB family hemolysin secretion/activation protein n=1 Tax=Actinobacillus pleuropneumoniae TaxID=715 RepID=UPI000B9A0C3D|nr:Hemolysin transporter protein ShlB [Actinobacillus pleuropneumoniae]MBL4536885.1 ShlB/FhaC/HecB family hemolysin secretion/activation protein [Actinobacillus pleuropneumoniae]UPK77798.1 ShlB/FhaC/HecB family hemolysin secretion/activation protein [Actinobacillus pleuropneumoniae]HDR1512063.1 ShlB/FhaC/HecB family hemolysin secretion/activation protein [Pasteurella multocida]